MSKRLRVKGPVPMSATLAIHDEVRRMREAGSTVFHLGFGEATFPVHPRILDAFQGSATRRAYLPVAGLPELRERVAGYYRRRFGLEAEAEQVLIGCGSKSLLFAALQAMEGDVLLTDPCWVTYEPQVRLAGLPVRVAPTRLEESYCLTAEGLRASLEEARAAGGDPATLILSSPGNPTGTMYPPELLASLAEVARAEGLLVISDEIYALTAYGDVEHRSIASYYPEGTVVTGGLSKHLSLGGWRLGVALLPPGEVGSRLRRCMTAVAGAVWTTPTAPVQYAAVAAYGDDSEIDAYIQACATIHGRIARQIHGRLQALEVPCAEPSGAFYVYPSFRPWSETLTNDHRVETCGDLCRLLLQKQQIAALPGSDFGSDPSHLSVRLSTSHLQRLGEGSVERVLELSQPEVPDERFRQEVCPDLEEVCTRLGRFVDSLENARMAG